MKSFFCIKFLLIQIHSTNLTGVEFKSFNVAHFNISDDALKKKAYKPKLLKPLTRIFIDSETFGCVASKFLAEDFSSSINDM